MIKDNIIMKESFIEKINFDSDRRYLDSNINIKNSMNTRNFIGFTKDSKIMLLTTELKLDQLLVDSEEKLISELKIAKSYIYEIESISLYNDLRETVKHQNEDIFLEKKDIKNLLDSLFKNIKIDIFKHIEKIYKDANIPLNLPDLNES